MDPLVSVAILVGGFLLVGLFINRKLSDLMEKQKPSGEILEYLKVTNTRLDEHGKSLNERLDNAARVIGDVQKNIGEMSEIGRNMRDLQEFLKSPKLRGNVGEQVLKELLGQFLPKASFHLQYAFRSGEKVDAAIVTSAGIVPIDSKFPMENFRRMMSPVSAESSAGAKRDFERDVKKHIDDIARKYILTDEGTIDYALMYIPSEAVYYEIVNNLSLFEYASSKRILPVSPTTFYAYMRAILMSFEGQKIEQRAKEILIAIRSIQKDYVKVEDNLGVLQKHMTNAYNMMGNVFSAFGQLGQKIASTGRLGEEERKELPDGTSIE